MQFTWVDYPNQYEAELETWCDETTVRHALDYDSIRKEHEWYIDSNDYTINKNYFCKVVLDGEAVVALVMLTMHSDETKTHFTENIIYFDTFIINPALRHQGYAAKIITELMQNTAKIVPFENNVFVAQIHKDNDVSKKLFKKLDFHFIYTDAEANDNWFDWIHPASAENRYLAWRE